MTEEKDWEKKLLLAYSYYRNIPKEDALRLVTKYCQLFKDDKGAFAEFAESELKILRKEKRIYLRVDTSVIISYRRAGVSDVLKNALSQNLSASGGELLLEEIFPENTILELGIKLPQDKKLIHVKGRVLRQKYFGNNNRNNNLYITGVEFVEIDVENRRRLINYVHNAARIKRVKPDD
ncbi:MAG: PilZ domain-containing protein [Candidatus Omnitrophota bacterium]